MTQRCIAGGIWSKTISPKSRSSAPSPRDTTRQSKASAPTSTLPLRSSPQGKCQQTLVCDYHNQSFVCLIENGTLIEFTGRTDETVDVYGGYLIQEVTEDPAQNSLPLEVYWDDKK